MASFPNPTKCDYCGSIVSSTYELLTQHSCYCRIGRKVIPQSSRIHGSNAIKKKSTQALKTFRPSSSRRRINVKNKILGGIQNDSIANLSKVYHDFKPVVMSSQFTSPSSSSSSWEVLDESEMPIPVIEKLRFNEFVNESNKNATNNVRSAPIPLTGHQNLPPKSSEISSSLIPLELVPSSSSDDINVMLISPIDNKGTIVSLNDVMDEIERIIGEFPYEIRLKLEYEFLQSVLDAVNEEQKR